MGNDPVVELGIALGSGEHDKSVRSGSYRQSSGSFQYCSLWRVSHQSIGKLE
jgi:hypothetical protein